MDRAEVMLIFRTAIQGFFAFFPVRMQNWFPRLGQGTTGDASLTSDSPGLDVPGSSFSPSPQPLIRHPEDCKFLDAQVGTQDVEVPFFERKIVLNGQPLELVVAQFLVGNENRYLL
jgi:hypothetical protein